jgi:hypothetical protein
VGGDYMSALRAGRELGSGLSTARRQKSPIAIWRSLADTSRWIVSRLDFTVSRLVAGSPAGHRAIERPSFPFDDEYGKPRLIPCFGVPCSGVDWQQLAARRAIYY